MRSLVPHKRVLGPWQEDFNRSSALKLKLMFEVVANRWPWDSSLVRQVAEDLRRRGCSTAELKTLKDLRDATFQAEKRDYGIGEIRQRAGLEHRLRFRVGDVVEAQDFEPPGVVTGWRITYKATRELWEPSED